MLGAVVFYEPNYYNKTIKEIGRTNIVSYMAALDCYCETPNPASQMVKGNTTEEVEQELKNLEERIKDPKFLEDLFECI